MNPRFSPGKGQSDKVTTRLNQRVAPPSEKFWSASRDQSDTHLRLHSAIAQCLSKGVGQIDPSTLQAARAIYQRYRSIENRSMPKALGVAIDPVTHRGQVVLTDCPVLLPQERFISIQMLQAG